MIRATSPLALAILAALLRVALVLALWQRSGATLEFDDERLHWQLARNLVQHGALRSDDGALAVRMPAYPLFLAAFAGFGDAGILAARLGQTVLGGAGVWLLTRWARDALGPRRAALAGLLATFDPFTAFFCNLLLSETLYIVLSLAAAYAVWRALARRTSGNHSDDLMAALAGGAALLTRPSAAGWVVLLLVLLLCARRGNALRRGLLYAAILAGLLLPWGLRNRALLGDFAWLSTNGGITLYDALGPQADGSSDQSFVADHPELAALDEVARDRAWRRMAFDSATCDPRRVLQLAAVKLARFWNPLPNVASYRDSPAAAASAAWMLLILAMIAVAAVRNARGVRGPAAGATASIQARDAAGGAGRLVLIAALTIVYFTLLHCVYIGSVRYRVPLMPFLELLAVLAICERAAIRAESARP
ncbi:MAG: hypothetical protein CHACPFDD_00205 [Phycisphaerae bacterium]|nr:hypothetical protein [Phycisphaerae bacterium]